MPPGRVAAVAVGGAVATLAVTVIVFDAAAWLGAGAQLPPPAAGATAAALILLVAATFWRLLPGRVGAVPTRGWPTVLAVALPLVAGPSLAVAVVGVATVCALAVDRLRPTGIRTALRDLAGVTAAGAALALAGAEGPPPMSLIDAPVAGGIAAAALVTIAFAGAYIATETVGVVVSVPGGSPSATAFGRTLRENGLPLLVLLILGLVLAVLLTSSVWLAVGTLGAVSAVGVLTDSARTPRGRDVDPLTGLMSRHGLQEAAARAVDLAVSGGPPVAMLVVDLDRFQEVNDSHGHRTGDRVLRVVAQRLRAATRPHDVVARLGGDEFGVLVPGVRDVDGLVDLARRLRVSLGERIDGHEPLFGPGASVGIAVAPDHARTVSQLLARADLAVHGAKESVSGIRVHDGRHDHTSAERLGMVAAVRSALDGDAVQLAYQPKVALGPDGPQSDRMAGVEALVRFTDPRHPGVEPGRVVPVVEGTTLMGRLTTAVLGRALAQAARWLTAGESIPVAVNVSLRDLEDPDFADRTYAALVAAGVPGSLLTLEITERVLTGDLSAVVCSMERLERIGVRMSLDDFGTGWSSLLLLRRLPVAEVKLDRSFVAGIARDDADAAVVESVVALSHRLGLTMVAEGVEEPEQLARLRRAGCDVVQGYLLSCPLPPEEVVPWSAHVGPARLRVVS